jgi:hypothetical protein
MPEKILIGEDYLLEHGSNEALHRLAALSGALRCPWGLSRQTYTPEAVAPRRQ